MKAIGALLAGMVVAGAGLTQRVGRLIVPLRDVFAAVFFFWFGLTIAPSDMGAIALPVALAVVVTITFNVIAGVVAARIYGYGRLAAANTAFMLVSRGEFELILASLAVAAGLDARVAPFAQGARTRMPPEGTRGRPATVTDRRPASRPSVRSSVSNVGMIPALIPERKL